MKIHISNIILTTMLTMLLNGCVYEEGSKKNSTYHGLMQTCPTFTTLTKDDKIMALDENTKMRIIHQIDGSKKACVLNGSIQIN